MLPARDKTYHIIKSSVCKCGLIVEHLATDAKLRRLVDTSNVFGALGNAIVTLGVLGNAGHAAVSLHSSVHSRIDIRENS